ncbi:MAG TPA: CDP-alcohol phosphatidyltransferase family protein, partial [Anaerolineae bacterium]|nr:CDP-alcohol phosphatidyltransferase family protein [Anaerolineae bacterium]
MNGIIDEGSYTRREKATAWGVHLLTASGAIWGVLTLVAVMEGRWTMVFLLMMLTIFIDSIDGTLARRAQVKSVLPNFDGALLDNMVDYFTFVLVPAFILYNTYLLPAGWELLGVSTIVLSSAYQFSQGDAKTDDHYFKGFPSYWNLAVFYLFFLGWPVWVNFGFITFLGIMVFVPIKYIYPSRTKYFQKLTLVLT